MLLVYECCNNKNNGRIQNAYLVSSQFSIQTVRWWWRPSNICGRIIYNTHSNVGRRWRWNAVHGSCYKSVYNTLSTGYTFHFKTPHPPHSIRTKILPFRMFDTDPPKPFGTDANTSYSVWAIRSVIRCSLLSIIAVAVWKSFPDIGR